MIWDLSGVVSIKWASLLQMNYWVPDKEGQRGKESPGLGVGDLNKPINLPNLSVLSWVWKWSMAVPSKTKIMQISWNIAEWSIIHVACLPSLIHLTENISPIGYLVMDVVVWLITHGNNNNYKKKIKCFNICEDYLYQWHKFKSEKWTLLSVKRRLFHISNH